MQAVLLRRAARAPRGAAAARAERAAARGRLRVGALEIDPPSRECALRGRAVELSQKEFALLRALAGDPTRVFTKDELLRDVWGFRALGHDAHAGLARLPAAGQARRRRATASSSTCGASATGSSTTRFAAGSVAA